MSAKIVVVGASAAGLKAAVRAKRLLPRATITVLDRRKEISVSACGLPFFVSGEIDEAESLRSTSWGALRDEAYFHGKGLVVKTNQEVLRIDRKAGSLSVRDRDSGQKYELEWDQLVLATGARPRQLPGLSPSRARLSSFSTLDDARRWRSALQGRELKSVAIIGAGAIGIELASAFASLWGCGVQLIEGASQVLPANLDAEMAAIVETQLEEEGIRVFTGRSVTRVEESGDGLWIETSGGPLEAEHAIVAVGVEPVIELAREAELAVGPAGGIAVDHHLRTSDERIFAAGDCVESPHRISGGTLLLPLGSLANREGRVVGDNLAGLGSRFGPVVGSWALGAFDLNLAGSGLTEAAARRLGTDCAAVWGTFSDRAHFHPADRSLYMKLVFERETEKLLGLQVVGEADATKRVDVFTSLLHRRARLADLADLEFAYAPPYAGPLDPLHELGFMATSQLHDKIVCAPPDVTFPDGGVVDLRTPQELKSGPRIPGAIELPMERLREHLAEIPRGRELLLVCGRGSRSSEAARVLVQAGDSNVRYLGGGLALRGRLRTPSPAAQGV